MIAADTMVGTRFGPYLIRNFVGRGGMGIVYRAEHIELGRMVALKLLAPELAENSSFRERFVRESRIAASLEHPNVIPIYDASEIEGRYFIAMRYVAGLDLKQLLASDPSRTLPLPRTLSILGQIGGALDAAHARGLVHRDVKPGNILTVADSEHCYLTDFGLTKAASSNSGVTGTGRFVGTVDYCAPEQIEGRPLDSRTDVYSLGCVLFECLTGDPPYDRDGDVAVMYAHINEPPPRISDRRADLPQALDAVIATAMAKRIGDRFGSCVDLATAAAAAVDRRPGVRSTAASRTRGAKSTATGNGAGLLAGNGVVGSTAEGHGSAAFTHLDETPGVAAVPHGNGVHGPVYQNGTPVQAFAAEPPPEGKQRPLTAIAVIAAALILGLGGAAAAVILTQGGGSKNASSTTPGQTPTTPPSQSQPTTPPSSGGDTSSGSSGTDSTSTPPAGAPDPSGAKQVVEDYWNAIDNNDFHRAFNDYSPRFKATQNEDSWVQDHEAEHIQSAKGTFSVAGSNGDTATVNVDSLQTNDDHGCQNWSGNYDVVYQSGTWLIDQVNLNQPQPC